MQTTTVGETPNWYYLDESSKPIGPYSVSTIQVLFASGHIKPTTFLWRDGQSGWLPLSSIPEFSSCQVQAQSGGNNDKSGDSVNLEASSGKNDGEAEDIPPPDGEDEFLDDDGTQYKWDRKLGVWVPQDQDPPQIQQEDGYDPSIMTFVPDEAIPSALPVPEEAQTADVSQESLLPPELNLGPGKKGKGEKKGKRKERGEDKNNAHPEGWVDLKVTTSVYVSGLPSDATVDELVEVFSKCGVIKEDLETGKPKAKLYYDKQSGMAKGDGLVTYLKAPSVDLAMQILDGTALRPGGTPIMSVSPAKFEQKGEVFVKKAVPQGKLKKVKKMAEKVLGWGGFDDAKVKVPMTVVLKKMFTRDEILQSEEILKEVEEDVREECLKFGEVDKIKAYDNHPDGIVIVKFKDKTSGQACIEKMNGRWFGGRQIIAKEDDGLVNYATFRDEEWEELRLEKFGAELEAE